MDLLNELRVKLAGLADDPQTDGVKAAIHHIEVAERHLARARVGEDSDAYNDVIYRTNQAFEGMLKEAYTVIADADGSEHSPHQIEQYFLKDERLAPRVMSLFRNYRQEWRNPSTHDHRLVFRDDECLLAIVSISAFAVVLLDQIIETINFKRQRTETERMRDALVREFDDFGKGCLAENVAQMLRLFSESHDTSHDVRTEAELIGRISGFLVGLAPDIRVSTEEQLGDGQRGDLVVRRGNEAVVVEVKRRARSARLLESGLAQVRHYLNTSKLASGILYVAPYDTTRRVQAERFTTDDGRVIWLVAPATLVSNVTKAAHQSSGADAQ
jgi:hypothetical protein